MKKLLILFAIFAIFFSFFTGSVSAKKDADIPEVDGVYDDPIHTGLKVRVIVHKVKPAPPPEPTLQCIGITDLDSSAPVSYAGWELPDSWKYNLNPSSVPTFVGGENLATFAGLGFAEWSGATGVSFTAGPETTIARQAYDGQNIIAWGRVSASNALAITYIRYYTGGYAVDVDTIMNKRYPWSWAEQTGSNLCAYAETYDAQNILTHELGHWVGLGDHYTSEYFNNTMYGYGSKMEVKNNTLTAGDRAGASSIYGN